MSTENRSGIVAQRPRYKQLSREEVREIRERVLARHAAELASASWWWKIVIWLKMASEFKGELSTHSAHSLYIRKEAGS